MNVFSRLFQEVRPHWKLALAGMAFSLAMAVLELMPSVLTRSLLDTAINGHNSGALYRICGLLLAVQIGYAIAYWGRVLFTGKLGQLVVFQLRTRLYEHLQSLSLTYFDNNRSGQIMNRATSDITVLEQFVVSGVRDLLVNLLKLLLIAVILFLRNPTLALLTLVPTMPLAWCTRWFNNRIRAKYHTMSRRMADMSAILSDTISGIRVVQVFAQEQHESDKFRQKSEEFKEAGLGTQQLLSFFYPSVTLAFGIGQVIVWVLGGLYALQGKLTPGDLIMFATLVAQFYSPVQALSQMSNIFASTSASAERVYEVLDMQPEIKSPPNPQPLTELKGEIAFEKVSFGYDGAEPTLQEVSLQVQPGETVGLVGPSGSGKSTLASLVTRFYDVQDGAVKVDGHDVRELDLKDLRRHISVVLQEPYLFHGTIRHNIAYGRPEAGFEEVMDAARAANAHTFIMDLPDGYDTQVGERGAKLSGGQRQRISIARAILDDPRILILDEATSAVDTESEVQIQQALDNLMADRTTLAIAHRLSTVQNANKLVVLDGGHIVEVGSHDELMQIDGGLYKRLVEMQNKANTGNGEEAAEIAEAVAA